MAPLEPQTIPTGVAPPATWAIAARRAVALGGGAGGHLPGNPGRNPEPTRPTGRRPRGARQERRGGYEYHPYRTDDPHHHRHPARHAAGPGADGDDGDLSPCAKAREIQTIANRYAASAWRHDRNHDEMPERYAGTPHGLLWRAFKSGAIMPIGERQLRNIFAK